MLSRALSRLRLLPVSGASASSQRSRVLPPQGLTRSLVVLSSPGSNHSFPRTTAHASSLCSCGCGIHGIHTRGDRELVEFLQEEIVAEKKNVQPNLPSHLNDFSIKASAAELTLTRSFHDEKITITLNVNHTVDTEDSAELSADQSEAILKSKPSFEVDIVIGTKTLSFTCSYTSPGEGQEAEEDVFGINEVTMYEGEWSEATYCVSGDILDGMMYDLLMNMLEERGITNEFAEQLSTVCSDYEHSQYVTMLQKVQDFVKRK